MKADKIIFKAFIFFFLIVISPRYVYAELSVDSVYPNLGITNENFSATIKGSGFSDNTRASLYLDSGNAKNITSILETLLRGHEVIVRDKYAIVGRDFAVTIVDISDKYNPKIVNNIEKIPVFSLFLSDNFLFTVGNNKMYIIDISDVANPSIKSWIEVEVDINVSMVKDYISDIVVKDEIAYLAFSRKGIIVIDISDIEAPHIISRYEEINSQKLAIYQNFLYADNSSSINIFDISDKQNLILKKEFNANVYQINDILIKDHYMYIAGGAYFIVYDITDPLNPREICRHKAGSGLGILDIALSDGKAYLCEGGYPDAIIPLGYGCIEVIDISKLTNPLSIGRFETPEIPLGVDVADDYAYVCCAYKGFEIIDVSHPIPMRELGHFQSDNQYSAEEIILKDKTVFLADIYEGLQIIDVSIPENPSLITTVNPDDGAGSIAIYGDMIFMINHPHKLVYVIDISNLSEARVISSFPTRGHAESIKIFGDFAYIESWNSIDELEESIGRIEIFDISNPMNPVKIGAYTDSDSIFVRDKIAYTCSDGNMVLYDIDTLEVIAAYSGPGGCTDINVKDNFAYITKGYYGLSVIDTEDITNKAYIKTRDYAENITISGNYAYVADSGSGVQVIDISNPDQHVIIGNIETSGRALDVAVSNGLLYIADERNGLVIQPEPLEVEVEYDEASDSLVAENINAILPGNYTLKVYDKDTGESAELPGAITFVTPDEDYLLNAKAIIVLGDKSDNNIRDELKLNAEKAYDTLLFQGYTAESIYYFSGPDNSVEYTDGIASSENIRKAILEWAIEEPEANELLIYFVGHGNKDEFIINDNDKLKASQFNEWLDELQDEHDIPVTFIYDACYSGSFQDDLKGNNRIIITSSSPDQVAYFPSNGTSSFSYQFWSAIYNGDTLSSAFQHAKDQMRNFQSPLINSDNDEVYNEKKDDYEAADINILRGYHPQIDVPYIYEVSEPRVLTDKSSAMLKAGASYIKDGTEIDRVWAIIVPPDFDHASGSSTNFPEIDLLPSEEGSNIYTAEYDQFTKNGEYKIVICAMNKKGIYSLFRNTSVTRESSYIIDVNENKQLYDNNTETELWASLNIEYSNIQIEKVVADIYRGDQKITTIDLEDDDNDGVYKGSYDGFTDDYSYTVKFSAIDSNGYKSPPVCSTIIHSTKERYADEYESDDDYDTRKYIATTGFEQVHNFHNKGDIDWIQAHLAENIPYKIVIEPTDCNPVIQIFIGKNSPITDEIEDGVIDISPDKTGFYCIKVKNSDPDIYGKNVRYKISVTYSHASAMGTISGTVLDPSGMPLSDILVTSTGGGAAMTSDSGSFLFKEITGDIVLSIEGDGYEPYHINFTVNENETQFVKIVLCPEDAIAGDINGNGKIELEDGLMALQVLCGIINRSNAFCSHADINGDGRIGLEEAIYAIQKTAEIF